METKINICWLRRDLRFDDNVALYHALGGDNPVLLLFIFDRNILDDLDDSDDARVTFIHQTLGELNKQLKSKGSCISTFYGKPIEVWKELLSQYQVQTVYANRDYEPYARDRDKKIGELLQSNGISFNLFKDQVIFETDEILKDDGDPYVVYTPYSKQWKAKLPSDKLEVLPSALYFDHYHQHTWREITSLKEMKFKANDQKFPASEVDQELLENYEKLRNYPAREGASKIGIHLRFGTMSIRKLVNQAKTQSKVYLSELIWRDFFQMILWHFPRVVKENFYTKYDKLQWRNSRSDFEKWSKGQTGYPMVDAGMRQLNSTGYMHNRVRMITASFLTKHLLIDWRWGEAYFARKLLDYDLASNNGNWQWAAGTGVDAAPYFRIFNPHTQLEKFDPNHEYVKKWVPEYKTDGYCNPIVEHKEARERALTTFKQALD